MHPVQQQLLEESSPREESSPVVRLTLYPSQAKRFLPLLEDARDRAGGINGLLLTINRSQDLHEGHMFLELQAACLDPVATRKIQQLIAAGKS